MEELGDILKRLATKSTSADKSETSLSEPIDAEESCESCGGRGWFTPDVSVGHPDFGKVVNCDCQQRRIEEERYNRLLRYSNMGHLDRFRFQSLEPDGISQDPETRRLFKDAHRIASEYAESPSQWLVITGPHGSGKTHIAAAIGNRCIERGRIILFVHVPDLLDHLRATFGPASQVSYSDLFEQVKSSPLLILDGLGNHSTTPWAEEKLRQLVNHRYDLELPTVLTTSVPLEELDEYILSRIRIPGLSQILQLRSPLPENSRRLGSVEPELLRRMTFDTFDVRGNNPNSKQRASIEAAYMAAKNFADDPDGWLTLSGQTGVGKTHLAIAMAGEHSKKGNSVFFAFVPELLDHLRYTFTPESRLTYDTVFEEIKNTPLLILDDLGRERSSEWAVEKLYQIIVHRHNARLPTVITSSLTFKDDLDPITSRVQDPSVSQVVPLDAPDYRNKKRNPRSQRNTNLKRKPAS